MTVEEIARDALAAVGSQAGVLLASRWVANRYIELCALGKMRHLRRTVEVRIPGVIEAGAAAVERGSRNVYGNDVALAAWRADDIVGRFFRARTSWYRISGVGDHHLILDIPYAEEDSGTSPFEFGEGEFSEVPFGGGPVTGASYLIAAREIHVPLRHILAAAHPRRFHPIDLFALSELDRHAPERFPSFSGPTVCAEIGENEREKTLEFYPYSKTDELITLVGYIAPPHLNLRDTIPTSIDSYVLREGALIDVFRWESGKAAREGRIEAAAYFRNEYRAQETKWNEYKRSAYKTDLGVDDLGVVMHDIFGRGRRTDITNARDEVWSRGRRP